MDSKKIIYRQVPLYHFLNYCNKSSLPKRILDCGAGGNMPPLGMFYQQGYETAGIELGEDSIKAAMEFEKENQMKLYIQKGDMRHLPFEKESFSFVYSYNSIFHMEKEDIKKAIHELKRVLVPGGLLFVNLLSTEDFRCYDGKDCGNNQYLQAEDGDYIMHSYFQEEEADTYFQDMTLIQKEQRVMTRIFEGEYIRQGFFDYILKK